MRYGKCMVHSGLGVPDGSRRSGAKSSWIRATRLERVFSVAMLAFIVLLFSLLAMVAFGCSVKTTAGTTHQDDAGFTYTRSADGSVTVNDRRATAAATQPSVSTWGQMSFPHFGKADAGDIGSLSFEQAKARAAANWHLAIVFLGFAVVFYLLKNWVACLTSMGLGVLAVLYPPVLIYGAIGLVAYGGFSIYRTLSQAKAGFQVIGKQANLNGADAIGYAREEMDEAVQRIVGVK